MKTIWQQMGLERQNISACGVIQDLPVSAYREFISPLSLVPRSRIHCSPPHNVFGHLGCTIERKPEYMYTSVQNMGNK